MTVRFWWNRFGPLFAADIKRQRISQMREFRNWRWQADEVFVKINGETHCLWHTVDHEGEILESYVTKKRDKPAALRFFKKALKRHASVHNHFNSERHLTDRQSYKAARSDALAEWQILPTGDTL